MPKQGDLDTGDRQRLAPLLGQPVWRLFGLDGSCSVATSVTLGLGSVDEVVSRLHRWWRQLPATRIKLNLGSADGSDCATARRRTSFEGSSTCY